MAFSKRYKSSHPKTRKRTISEAKMIVDEDLTYEDIASRFNICPATVYKDMQIRLPSLDEDLYNQVCTVVHRHQVEAAGRAVKAREKKQDFIKKNFDLSIFDK